MHLDAWGLGGHAAWTASWSSTSRTRSSANTAATCLTVRDGQADCVPTDREPDLSLDVGDLGSVYLGGTTPSTLVRAGHIRAHRPGAAALADALFRAERSPRCLHWF